MTYFAPPAPRILAHRGLALGVPENTIAAFEAALATGVTHLETDAHATSDGTAVLWHDADLTRWNGQPARIDQLRYTDLQALRVDGHTIRSVEETLATLPHARFNIDVKSPAAAGSVARAVRELGAEDRVLLTSFQESTTRQLRMLVPAAAQGASSRRISAAVAGMQLRSPALISRALGRSDAVQIPRRAAGLDLVTPERLEWWHRYVREVHVWTINDPEEQRELLELGVDGVVTDRCDLATGVTQEFLAQ
ncbi:glycerophosphodiester phosphodiesterase family protein [Gulosibacter faecalis]|uniref:Glycerophosphodiester phosphodiesterase family protein n=1 Tax=Gulosibacter faecalis TaxID=272240 RepID=A0ABW5V1U1_9MICO|nr:glycerophosphodiester phosphodiesterase family protein [Gulosibacter faecalis]